MLENSRKAHGQVFTPPGIIAMILDAVGYKNNTLLDKKIMEPSFGNGAFLSEIISRIINECKKQGKPPEEIKNIIESNVYGIEKDKKLYDEAISKLNKILIDNNIPISDWENLKCGDTLFLYCNYIGKMDICVGNPPYVRIHNIETEYRDIVKDFQFAGGTTDLYVVFYEIGINMLKKDGRLSYITPNSFLKNTSQKKFRNYLIDQGLLSAIYDFKDSKIFNADTYTCICLIDKNQTRNTKNMVEYREYDMYKMQTKSNIKYEYFLRLKNTSWNLGSEENVSYIQENIKRPVKIKEIAIIQNGIATNRDSIYIGKAWLDEKCTKPYMGKHTDREKIVWFNGNKIESTILHRCVKASRYEGKLLNNYILYPYHNVSKQKTIKKSDNLEVDTNYTPYTEEEMQAKFPNVYNYLQKNRKSLEARDMDTNLNWFVFGRSQGIKNSGYKKLVIKHVICKETGKINVNIVDEDVIVYSGIYITIDTSKLINLNNSQLIFEDALYNKKLEKIKEILTSDDFYKYCMLVGKDMQGGYVSISGTFIKNYGIPKINSEAI